MHDYNVKDYQQQCIWLLTAMQLGRSDGCEQWWLMVDYHALLL